MIKERNGKKEQRFAMVGSKQGSKKRKQQPVGCMGGYGICDRRD